LQQLTTGISLDPQPTTPAPILNGTIPFPLSFSATAALRYTVRVSNRSLYIKDVTVGAASILRKAYLPGSERLRITVGHDGGVIRAFVSDTNGQPSMDSAVIVFPANVQIEGDLATTMIEGFTNEEGAFQTKSLQPGRYIVLATNDPPHITNGPAGVLNIERSPEALARILRARDGGQFADVGPRATIQVNLTPRTLE
jgi:hypothetical protein